MQIVCALLFFSSLLHAAESVELNKQNYQNLFDAFADNASFFTEIPSKKQNPNVYENYLKVGTMLLKNAFKEFIKRHQDNVINTSNFRQMKTYYKYSLTTKNPYINRMAFFECNKEFIDAWKQECKNELICMKYSRLELLQVFSLYYVPYLAFRQYYQQKDNAATDINKKVGTLLKKFCTYALLYYSSYIDTCIDDVSSSNDNMNNEGKIS